MVRVRGHYRHLSNGKLVHIDEYKDKRKEAQADPAAFAGKVAHADEASTTVLNHRGQPQTFANRGEMTRPQIHAQLNRPLPVNADLARQVVHHQMGIKDHASYLKDLSEEEGLKSKPRFNTVGGAHDWFEQNFVTPKMKELRQAHGKTTTPAKAYGAKHKDLRQMWDTRADSDEASHHEQAIGKMLQEHGEEAHQEATAAIEEAHQASEATPAQAPKIHGIATSVRFLGHQAEALARMNQVNRCATDIDMGGGKGLILPADALALMTQGKVKKPLVVVPANTLDQNAAKLVDQYSEGGVNVFKISTDTIAKHYGGDISKMVEDIGNAPKNTVFMATYDAVAHQDRGGGERFGHAQALGAAGFDYVAADECHNIANEDSSRFQAFTHLAGAPYVRMASGTFLANNPSSLIGPLKLLFPQMDFDQKKLESMYGKTETDEGVTWSREGLKKLRQDMLDLGMVSLRRSAWMDKLPKRTDALSVVHMTPAQEKVHEAVLNDAMDQLEREAEESPMLQRALEDGELNPDAEMPPAIMRKLEILQGVTDYPDELARMIEGNVSLATEKPADDPEAAEAIEVLKKFSPAARNALLSLKDTVSPKAEDVYDKAAKHLKDPKNGKFIVFVQRKAAARHIMAHMPEELAGTATYFDASKLEDLGKFTGSPEGPRLLVAVDASVKEGVNMQVANGMYRYDHHLTPGNQEQSLARVWRLGQDKPTALHFGIVHNGMDVTKYARLCSKLSTNMQVVSDFEPSKETPIYRLSIDNIRENRDSSILNQYQDLVEEILDHQKDENKGFKKKYGDETHQLGTGEAMKGSEEMHGKGAFHPRTTTKKAFVIHRRVRRSLVDLLKAARYRQPAHIGSKHAAEKGASKVTKVDEVQRGRIRRIVSDAIRNKDSTDRLTRRLRHSANSGGYSGDDRNWKRVAVTEVNDARARGALDHIIKVHGPKTLVIRQTNKCCPTCCNAFGKHVRRIWRADYVPEKYKGTVHPNCKCGAWMVANPLRKAFRRLKTSIPFGTIKRTPDEGKWTFAIWAGQHWTELESVTGRSVLRAVLARTPLVVADDGPGWVLARVGHGRALRGSFELLDPVLAHGRYYPANPMGGDRPPDYRGTSARTRDDYIEGMLAILPTVCTMPEPWKDRLTADVADFLGYKMFTDWWVLMPSARADEAFVADEDAGAQTGRTAVKKWTRTLLGGDSMRKHKP